jgi:GNAT superfamily N-acetyltransferase
MTYQRPEPLASRHRTDGFTCTSIEQTEWLRQHARQSTNSGTTKVFVVAEAGSDEVVAYYAWCMASLSITDAPPRLRQGAARYPQPVALLARLGVDSRHAGHGLGAGLLQDVVLRLVEAAAAIGCRGLLIHAESDEARRFYLHLLPELEASPTDDLHLVLLMKDVLRTLRP